MNMRVALALPYAVCNARTRADVSEGSTATRQQRPAAAASCLPSENRPSVDTRLTISVRPLGFARPLPLQTRTLRPFRCKPRKLLRGYVTRQQVQEVHTGVREA